MKRWDKRYSGPHCCWLLVRNGRDVLFVPHVPLVVFNACEAAGVRPEGGHAPLLFRSEAEIDRLLVELARIDGDASKETKT